MHNLGMPRHAPPNRPAPSAEADDLAIQRLERRLRILEAVSEKSMKLVDRLHDDFMNGQRAKAGALRNDSGNEVAPAADAPEPRDAVDAFCELASSIRRTILEEARTDAALRALRAAAAERARRRERPPAAPDTPVDPGRRQTGGNLLH